MTLCHESLQFGYWPGYCLSKRILVHKYTSSCIDRNCAHQAIIRTVLRFKKIGWNVVNQ